MKKEITFNVCYGEEEEKKNVVGLLVENNFDEVYEPLTSESLRFFLPLNGLYVIDYQLHFFKYNDIKKIYIVVTHHEKELQSYVEKFQKSKRKYNDLDIEIIKMNKKTKSLGDVLRDFKKCKNVYDDILLLLSDTIPIANIKEIVKAHFINKEKCKNQIMTLLLTHDTNDNMKNQDEEFVIAYDNFTLKLLLFEYIKNKNYISITNEIFDHANSNSKNAKSKKKDNKPAPQVNNKKEPAVGERSIFSTLSSSVSSIIISCDVLIPNIYIITPEVLKLFEENFDYQCIRKDLIYNILKQEIKIEEIYVHELNDDNNYTECNQMIVTLFDFRTYYNFYKTLIEKSIHPFLSKAHNLLPDIPQLIYTEPGFYRSKNSIYSDDCKIFKSSSIGNFSEIMSDTTIENSTICKNCKVHKNVTIVNSIIGKNTIIKDNVVILNSFVSENVTINKNVFIDEGCIIGKNMNIPEGLRINKYTRLSNYKYEMSKAKLAEASKHELEDAKRKETKDEIEEEAKEEIKEEEKEEITEEIVDEVKEEIKEEAKDELTDETKEEIKEEIPEETKDEVEGEIKAEAEEERKEDIADETKEEIKGESNEEITEEIKEEAEKEVKDEIPDETKDEVKEEIIEEAKEEINEEVTEEIKEEAKDELTDETKDEVKEEIIEEIKEEVTEEAKEEIIEEVKEEAKDELTDETKEEVKDELTDETKEEVKDELTDEAKEEVKDEVEEEKIEESKADSVEEKCEEATVEEVKTDVEEEKKGDEEEFNIENYIVKTKYSDEKLRSFFFYVHNSDDDKKLKTLSSLEYDSEEEIEDSSDYSGDKEYNALYFSDENDNESETHDNNNFGTEYNNSNETCIESEKATFDNEISLLCKEAFEKPQFMNHKILEMKSFRLSQNCTDLDVIISFFPIFWQFINNLEFEKDTWIDKFDDTKLDLLFSSFLIDEPIYYETIYDLILEFSKKTYLDNNVKNNIHGPSRLCNAFEYIYHSDIFEFNHFNKWINNRGNDDYLVDNKRLKAFAEWVSGE
ncbi:conserved Plasmodium protein, unknown function [Plasmodium chabaudi chabaudi]|uniref:Translation initiation factor eIF2B subunit epsilon n=1 Tax=Plasmodium chabaudi chabaudi TaxID=31271 RepID=A0A4V0KCG7_PLACU|nr:conserved Plasmodium protein, unknown function [Plasmodium chabaudi chabaudi]VTZ70994.1 conserved Plasmodium protein, unknown function [Plasmodium chabaudi chabaudi]|eukprot:XP_016654933.1 conserved Plasmodium protein, unknown function [Plasmodium chabaudi chabaudi]